MEKERERDVGIICLKIYDDLALEALESKGKKKRARKREEGNNRGAEVEKFHMV